MSDSEIYLYSLPCSQLRTVYSLLALPTQLLHVVNGIHTDVNRMNQLLAGPGPPWVMWSSSDFLSVQAHPGRQEGYCLLLVHNYLRRCRKNALFLFLDLNQSIATKCILVNIDSTLLLCSWEGDGVTCLDAAAGHL